MRIYIGSDHAGFELKEQLAGGLVSRGADVVDCGPARLEPDDDYPPYCIAVARHVAGQPGSLGIVLGGSGNGEQIAANKVAGIRAALAWTAETARLARLHNDANVLALGARVVSAETAAELVEVFLATPFSGEERHARRIAMLTEYERTGTPPPLP